MADVPLLVISENSSSERRITPSWSISQLKSKLEPITGIPPSCQRLKLKTSANGTVSVQAENEDDKLLSDFPLVPYAELQVIDTRPANARPNFNDISGVEKYVMPVEEYESKADSVLAWKKAEKLGRFNPDAPSLEKAKLDANEHEIKSRGIEVGKRCRVGGDDARRGEIKFVGDVKEIPGALGAWIGIHLDEPVGKNDGSIGGTRYWGAESSLKHGVFVRPERVEVGDWPVVDDLEDMEEI
ncbi:putative CAP-Gly domain-containing protein [Rosellinia necatrix]|uniref:Putative CAP-Gly domain-containing protein n=1 Tax=Rosellinia necatrix TaxID=77044 RepID=A0A1S7UKP5_ROSNE|nr:putative CAP-Gly domain-containing protein [Rosellinia necatrix]